MKLILMILLILRLYISAYKDYIGSIYKHFYYYKNLYVYFELLIQIYIYQILYFLIIHTLQNNFLIE